MMLTMRMDKATGVSEFYHHFYGGKARDLEVSKQGFMRFFEVEEEFLDSMPFNIKLFDEFYGHCEVIGYKIKLHSDSKIVYRITFINYDHAKSWYFECKHNRKEPPC